MKSLINRSTIFLIFLCSLICISCEKKATIPVVTTKAVSDITTTSAKSGGTITSDGGATIISSGVCWSTVGEPTADDHKTTDAITAGSFTSNITNLDGGTVYYLKAYAMNSAGTGYGTVMSFTTLGQAPTASNTEITNVTTTSAVLNGSANANYLSTLVTFEYGTTTDYGNNIDAKQSPITGNTNTTVSADLTGLNPGTSYHFRVKAVNSKGTIFGSDITFTTLGQIPTAATQASTNKTISGATLNGSVNANYLSTEVTFEYGTSMSYGQTITANQSPVTGSTSTNVSADIADLTAGTSYHYRIKAVNSLGTTYSNDITFTTLGQVPSVIILSATDITTNMATLNGTVNANDLSTIVTFEYGLSSEYGQAASATQNPVIGNTNKSISISVSGLTLSTTYHYRIKAENLLGTIYSNDSTFKTTLTGIVGTLFDIEGNSYKSIGIGYQIWMAENLKTTKFDDGTPIPAVISNTDWNLLNGPAYCWYNNNSENKTIYGALYNWYSVNTNILCPTGWHVPTDAEWTLLTNYLGGEGVAGGKLKESGITHWDAPNEKATNESGFTALPGGYRYSDGPFDRMRQYEFWWTSDEYTEPSAAWNRHVSFESPGVGVGKNGKVYGFAVRCIKD